MIRSLIVALLAAAAALGSSYGAVQWSLAHRDAKPAEEAAHIAQKKTRVINVPIVVDGQVKGYVMAQFLYTADEKALKELASPPDAIILDEAFRLIYADEKHDFRDLKKVDLGEIGAELKDRVARRMKSDLVRDVMLEDFNYVSKDDIRK